MRYIWLPLLPLIMLATKAVAWKDLLKDHATWDTLIWFAAIIGRRMKA